MMRLIPGKTSVKLSLFKNITLTDLIVGLIGAALVTLIAMTPLSFRFWIAGAVLIIFIVLLIRIDTEPAYLFVFRLFRHAVSKKYFTKGKGGTPMKDLMAYTGISDGFIEYGGKYYGGVIEIPPVEFRFFSQHRRKNSIESGLGSILRSIHSDQGINIVKIERPIEYQSYVEREYQRLDALKIAFENGIMNEDELKIRSEVIYERINELNNMIEGNRVIDPFYYLVIFDSDKRQLNQLLYVAMNSLEQGELRPKRLNSKELALFLRYSNEVDFDEAELDKLEEKDYAAFAMPEKVQMRSRNTKIGRMITHHFRVTGYPMMVGDAWMAGLMSIPSTKVTIKCTPTDQLKTIRHIDHSIQELQSQYRSTGVASKQIELQNHIESLSELLVTLNEQNESLMDVNIYVTAYDRQYTETVDPTFAGESQRQLISNMRQTIRRIFREAGLKVNPMESDQLRGFIGAEVSGYDPIRRDGTNMPTNTIAAMFPWIFAHIEDEKGIKLGSQDGIPVMIDFFERNSERVNSNMVIVGKSGSGKSFATKSILTNLAAEDSKIFVLDPENEYTELAANLHGKFINVGNALQGRLNPFHIMTELEDDEDGGAVSGAYSMHMQFLEEFYKQILPDCDKDALEYLNLLTDRMYTNRGITPETNLSLLLPEDYPIFDDLYDEILKEFQTTDNTYIRTMLRTLVNYISKFSAGGRNASIWNGPSTITTDENFTVFNFQSLLSNRNQSIANAQMLLVLKYLDHEIIRNREYNLRKKQNRKVVVVIDEAHVFIDEKYPIALDFMFQLAKRIRKYNGMQIVITQNIKDFVGSEELARKSAAIINACQYSLIFSLAPNDMGDLCLLYEKAGGINETEQEEIVSAPRGQAFMVLGPQKRTTFRIDSSELLRDLFENTDYQSRYFATEEDLASWEDYIAESRILNNAERAVAREEMESLAEARSHVTVMEVTEEEYQDEILETIEIPEEIPDPAAKAPTVPYVQEDAPRVVAPESVTVSVKPEGFEDMMSKLSEIVDSARKLSYEAMREEVLRAVNENMGNMPKMSAPVQQAAVSPVDEPEYSTSDFDSDYDISSDFGPSTAHDDEESSFDDFLSSLTGSVDEDEDDTPAAVSEPESDDEEEDDEPYFDIMKLLQEQAEEMADRTPIDQLEEEGVDVVEVTLDELIQYMKQNS